jgi:hypothetical protein
MNAISYINGDTQVTDFPACSARPLAALVQSCNDLLAGPGGYLSPDNSLLALELGWQTVGTADVADSVIHAWVAELLTNPTWGVVRYANIGAIKAIIDIAQLHRNVASGHTPPVAAWDTADRAARAAARAISRTSNPAGLYAVRAAYESTAIVDTHHQAALDAVTGNALRAHILASGDTRGNRIVELTRHAIRSWRHLAGLANPSEPSPRQADQPDRAAADRARLTYPAHRAGRPARRHRLHSLRWILPDFHDGQQRACSTWLLPRRALVVDNSDGTAGGIHQRRRDRVAVP